MPAGYAFQTVGDVPVIRAPAEIDATTADQLRSILRECRRRGRATVVDMTGTVFCDATGLRELMRAHERAVADGGELRLVTAGDGVLRIFAITGLDGVIPRYATLQEALAPNPAGEIRSPPPGRAREPAAAPASPLAHTPEDGQIPAGSRSCEQCGAVFVPAREHARFCTGDCRTSWNREHSVDPVAEATALTWSIAAMSEAAAGLSQVMARDQQRGLAAIGEAVWRITILDATLVRQHPEVYEAVIAARTPAGRQLIEETLAGLRFVRNWIGRGAGLAEAIETGTDSGRITRWAWKPVPEPPLVWLPLRAQAWERARHQAYQGRLAGHTIEKTFGHAVTFLTRTGADAASITEASERSSPCLHGAEEDSQ